MSKYQNNNFCPFLMRFSEEIKRIAATPARYNEDKNLVEVYKNGSWINSSQVTFVSQDSTKVTDIAYETTDDD